MVGSKTSFWKPDAPDALFRICAALLASPRFTAVDVRYKGKTPLKYAQENGRPDAVCRLLGETAVETAARTGALNDLRSFLDAADPSDAVSLFSLGELLSQRGETDEAIAELSSFAIGITEHAECVEHKLEELLGMPAASDEEVPAPVVASNMRRYASSARGASPRTMPPRASRRPAPPRARRAPRRRPRRA